MSAYKGEWDWIFGSHKNKVGKARSTSSHLSGFLKQGDLMTAVGVGGKAIKVTKKVLSIFPYSLWFLCSSLSPFPLMTLGFQRKYFWQKDQVWTQHSKTGVLWIDCYVSWLYICVLWRPEKLLHNLIKIAKYLRKSELITTYPRMQIQHHSIQLRFLSYFQKGQLTKCPHSSEHSTASKAKKNSTKPK